MSANALPGATSRLLAPPTYSTRFTFASRSPLISAREFAASDGAGRSFITFEDYAAAVLDELERPQHVAKRFGVAY